jgi:hypothetical protein
MPEPILSETNRGIRNSQTATDTCLSSSSRHSDVSWGRMGAPPVFPAGTRSTASNGSAFCQSSRRRADRSGCCRAAVKSRNRDCLFSISFRDLTT